MKKIVGAAAILIAFSIGASAPAAAQYFRTWVASTGDDTNSCSFDMPCLTLAGAIGKTNVNGEILCATPVVSGGTITIVRSVTINCEAGLGTNTQGLSNSAVSVQTAAGDTVVLRGIDFDLGAANSGTSTLNFNGAGTLILDRSKITGSKTTGNGLFFQPNGTGKLVITNSIFTGAGNGTAGAGIRIAPQPGGTAQVSIKNSSISGNTFGIAVDGSNSTGGINASIVDTLMSANVNDGVVATTSASGAPVGILISNSQSHINGFGVRSIGNATVRVDNSRIIGNGTGILALSGGALLTVGNNVVEANAVNGTFTGSFGLK